LPAVDHLVLACPDLDAGIDAVARLVGVRASAGGSHPGGGTRNALLSLGPSAYLEIIGPDRDAPAPDRPRLFGIDALRAPRLAAWAAKATDLDALSAQAARRGVRLGAVASGSRRRPDGILLAWRYTSPAAVLGDGLVPFFIDWGPTPHPARTAPSGATLVGLRAEHPEPARIRKMLAVLNLALTVASGPEPALIATLEGPAGRVELR